MNNISGNKGHAKKGLDMKSADTYILISLLIELFFAGCSNTKPLINTQAAATTDSAGVEERKKLKGLYIPAEVVDMTGLDGCSFMIRLESGEKLEPVNLPEEFKKNKKKILLRFEYYHGMSICMAGRMITIKDIKENK